MEKVIGQMALIGLVALPFVVFFFRQRKRAREEAAVLAELPEAERTARVQARRQAARRKGLIQLALGVVCLVVAGVSFANASESEGIVWTGGLIIGFALAAAGAIKLVVGRDM